jgi:predicted nucleic acid-binding protein
VILLDTNVVSELMRSLPDPRVERWFLFHEEECCLASVSISELAYGIAKLEEGARRYALAAQLAEWRVRFAERTLGFGAATAMIYGELLAEARRKGRPMSLPDAQIAAIAKEHGSRLATRNVADFESCGVELVNPWG